MTAASRPAEQDGGAWESQPLTEELLAALRSSTSLDRYLETAPTRHSELGPYLLDLIDRRGLRRSDAIRASGVNATFAYQIFQGQRRPGRSTALQLALGIGCTLREAQRLLRLSDNGRLWPRDRRDAIVIYCLEHVLTRQQCDEELYRLGEPILEEWR